jgi:beta-glucosidase
VALQRGESREVTIPIPLQQLTYWDVSHHRWVLERNNVEVRVGSSSSDIRMRTTLAIGPVAVASAGGAALASHRDNQEKPAKLR